MAETKVKKADKPDKKADKPDKKADKPDKKADKPDKKAAKPDQKAAKPDQKAAKPDKKAAKPDKKAAKPDQKAVKTDKKAVKTDKKSVKTDKKSVKTDKKSVKTPKMSVKTPKMSVKTPKMSVKTDKMSVKTIKKPVKPIKPFKKPVKTIKKSVKPGMKSVKGGRVRYGKVALKPNTFIEKPIGGEKNGGTRLVRVKKLPAYYATQLNPKKRAKRVKRSKRPLRSSITPGTVCILLAGIHKGKKVVFLKEMGGGLCLVTGPFKINACPMRRVNQIFLIATSTKVDISSFGVPKHINDRYFRRVKASCPKKEEGDIFERKQEKYVPSDQRKKDQAVVDGMVISAIKKREDKKMLFGYLGTMFGLRKKMYPHRINF